MTITILSISIIVVSFVYYFLCYRLAVKENPALKNATVDSVRNEMLNKSIMASAFSIKDKSFWLSFVYIMIGVPIVMNIAEIIQNYFGNDWNEAIEWIIQILCSILCFFVLMLGGFRLVMLVIKRKHKQTA